jgi:hypothetical protein
MAASPATGLERFAPPSRLGFLTGTFQGASDKTVVLIQDLHVNYGVQKSINGLLSYYAGKKLLRLGRQARGHTSVLRFLCQPCFAD